MIMIKALIIMNLATIIVVLIQLNIVVYIEEFFYG